MIENACPFAPGDIKPKKIDSPSIEKRLVSRIVNVRFIILLLTFLALTLLYNYYYLPNIWNSTPIVLQDYFIVKMSFYTYISGMISHFIRERKRKERN